MILNVMLPKCIKLNEIIELDISNFRTIEQILLEVKNVIFLNYSNTTTATITSYEQNDSQKSFFSRVGEFFDFCRFKLPVEYERSRRFKRGRVEDDDDVIE